MTSRSTSPSEGEIIETDTEKATKSLPSVNNNSVDRQSRKYRSALSQSPSPKRSSRAGGYRSRSRSRSPYRAPRGSKRAREGDLSNDRYDRNDRQDPRSFRVHYEDRHSNINRDRQSSQRDRDRDRDRDRRGSPSVASRQDDRSVAGQPRGKRMRTVSRSPPRFGDRRFGVDAGTRAQRDSPTNMSKGKARFHATREERYSREQSVSEKGPTPNESASGKLETEQQPNPSQKGVSFKLTKRSEADNSSGLQDHAKTVSPTLVPDPAPLSEAELIEQRRKRREAIKAKHKSVSSEATPLLIQVLDPKKASVPLEISSDAPGSPASAVDTLKLSPPATPRERSGTDSPSNFDFPKESGPANRITVSNGDFEDEPSAADYDPTADMREDRRRETERQQGEDIAAGAYDETKNDDQDTLLPKEESNAPKKKTEFDMFAEDDDDDDIFVEGPNVQARDVWGPTKATAVNRAAIDMSMLDDWDDEEGYYKIIIGELLDSRYHVQMNLGKGMFSGVVRAMDQVTQQLVAIKIIRSNETMRKAALKEIDILKSLKAADPDDRKHVIRLERYFEHKGHLCMVFENLSINLREVLKKFGHGVGINLRAVRAYAQQMFLGLSLLRKCNILHADLKPDNILVTATRSSLKICDLGSASDASDNEITPYLVSRFYRAPEIILGLPYDFAIDVWSVGCTLFELYTGKILFTGRNNNQMLRSIMECRGRFGHKMLRKAQFASLHFDDLLGFRSQEKDKITGRDVIKVLNVNKPTRDLRARVVGVGGGGKGTTDEEAREAALFVELLDKCLALNPEKRITPSEALRHPFILRGK